MNQMTGGMGTSKDGDKGAEAGAHGGAKKAKKKIAKGSVEDQWILFDDEDTCFYKYKDITGINIDLQGGRADTQIAYVLMFKRSTCVMPDCPPKEINIELKSAKDRKKE